jgi:hypothetical protein
MLSEIMLTVRRKRSAFDGCMWLMLREQADWALILPSATSRDSAAPLAEKNAAAY